MQIQEIGGKTMYWVLDRLLNLPDVTIVKVKEVEDLICLELEGIKKGIVWQGDIKA